MPSRCRVSDLGKLDAGDWLGVVVTGTIAGLGAAMGWFRSSNKHRDDKQEELETRMEKYETLRATQATQLALLESSHDNIKEKLDEIKEDIQRAAMQGAHSVNTQMAQVFNEVQKLVADNKRRS